MRKWIYAVLAIFALILLLLANLPFLTNNIFTGPLSPWPVVDQFLYFGAGNRMDNFAFSKDNTIYILSRDKFFAIPHNCMIYNEGEFVKVSVEQQNQAGLPPEYSSHASECDYTINYLEYDYPVNLLSVDEKNSTVYFAFNSDKGGVVYKYNKKEDKSTKLLSTKTPVISVSAYNGNVLVSDEFEVFVSYNGGNSFENLAQKPNAERSFSYPSIFHRLMGAVCFIDKQNGVYFISSQAGGNQIIFSTDCFKDLSKTKILPILGEGFVFKEVPLNKGKICFVTFPFVNTPRPNKISPKCYIMDANELLNAEFSKNTYLNHINNSNMQVVSAPEEIHLINDAVYWRNHIIFAANNGIWTYDLTSGKWYYHKRWGSFARINRAYKPINLDFNIKKLRIKDRHLFFFVDAPYFKGTFDVGI